MTFLQKLKKKYYTNSIATLREISIASNTYPRLRIYFELADSSLEAFPDFPTMLRFSIERIENDLFLKF